MDGQLLSPLQNLGLRDSRDLEGSKGRLKRKAEKEKNTYNPATITKSHGKFHSCSLESVQCLQKYSRSMNSPNSRKVILKMYEPMKNQFVSKSKEI